MPADSASEVTLHEVRTRIASLRSELRRHEHLYYVLDEPENQRRRVRCPVAGTAGARGTVSRSGHPGFAVAARRRHAARRRRQGDALVHHAQPRQCVGRRRAGRLRSSGTGAGRDGVSGLCRRAGSWTASRWPVRFGPERAAAGGDDSPQAGFLEGAGAASRLLLALTRGDGVAGEVITPNACTLRSLPLSVPASELAAKGVPAQVRGARRGSDADGGIRGSERAATHRWEADVREPAQCCGRVAANAGRGGYRIPAPRLLSLFVACVRPAGFQLPLGGAGVARGPGFQGEQGARPVARRR